MPCEAQPQARVSLKSTCSLPLLAYVVTFQAGHAGSIPATRFTKTRSLRRFTGPFLPARHLVTHATARAWERRVQSNTPKGDAHEAPSAHRGVRARNARRCRIGNCGPVRRQHDPGWPRRTSGRHVRTRAAVRRRSITAANGRTPPFPSQPVQGISAVLPADHGAFWVMEDNGYGTKANSADFLLRVYRVTPHFEISCGSRSAARAASRSGPSSHLRDPGHKVPWPIVNQNTADRLLTGADFDIESFRRARRRHALVRRRVRAVPAAHRRDSGELLEAPIPLPGVKSPDNPTLAHGEAPTLASSRGFEGMAISQDGATLYPMLEGALPRPIRTRAAGSSTSSRSRQASLHRPDSGRTRSTRRPTRSAISRSSTSHRFLVIERDQNQGADARRSSGSTRSTCDDVGADGFLVKHQVVDLLEHLPTRRRSRCRRGRATSASAIAFSMPFVTIESVLPLPIGAPARDQRQQLSVLDGPQPDSARQLRVRRAASAKAVDADRHSGPEATPSGPALL